MERAIFLLKEAAGRGSLSLSEAALALDVHKSTAYRLLATLARHEMVVQDSETEKYRIGPGLHQLVPGEKEKPDLLKAAVPECHYLSGQTGETATVSILDGGEIAVIHQTLPRRRVITTDWTGTRGLPHVTASGKVLMAFLPESRRKQLLAEPFPALTEHTVRNFQTLEEHLKKVWDEGYAVSDEELELGIRAVSAPIRDARGQVLAAVSISGPAFRMKREQLPEFGRQVAEGAARISKLLGH